MAFIAVSDSSYMIENCVIFASTYKNFGHLIEEGNVVMMSGKKSGNSFLINKVYGLN